VWERFYKHPHHYSQQTKPRYPHVNQIISISYHVKSYSYSAFSVNSKTHDCHQLQQISSFHTAICTIFSPSLTWLPSSGAGAYLFGLTGVLLAWPGSVDVPGYGFEVSRGLDLTFPPGIDFPLTDVGAENGFGAPGFTGAPPGLDWGYGEFRWEGF
jgi:hypothetical protein